MDTLRQDLLFAMRLLRKDRAYACAVVLTLALCLGANAAVFAVVQSVLLRPLPYPESDRLVVVYESFPGAGVERAGMSIPNHFDHEAMKDVFDSTALYQFDGVGVGEGPQAEGVPSMTVTPSFFRVLRATAVRGRVFTEADGEPGHEHVLVLGYGLAARQPAGVDHIVGTTLRVNHEVYTVVGVMPEGFSFLEPNRQLWRPTAFKPEDRSEDQRWSQNHEEIARLAPGVTVEQAHARLTAYNAAIVERTGPLKQELINVRYTEKITPLQADVVRDVRPALVLLWGGVLFVLLIAGVNLTNLALVRASGRAKELATRHALGAGSARVVRQLVTETLLLTLIGGALGILLGMWSIRGLPSLDLFDLPRAHEIRLDVTIVAFTLGLAVALGLIVGSVPTVLLAGSRLNSALRDEGRGGTASRGARYTRRALVAAQVALAFILLAGAGLLLASFQHVLRIDPGFNATGVWTGRLSPLKTQYPDDAKVRSYANRVVEGVRALPGVQAAGMTTFLPFGWDSSSSVIIAEGHVPVPGESVVSPNELFVTSGYLDALGVPLKRGRLFTDSDTEKSAPVIILDEQLARRFWPGQDPIGRRVYKPTRVEDVVKPGPDVVYRQVVGIIGDVKMKGLIEGEGARAGAYYIPFAQNPQRNIGLAVRTAGNPADLTNAIQRVAVSVDPELKPYDVFPLAERVEKSLNQRRTPMLLALAFGLTALLLASVGIYGVLAYQVAQRTREIGIRMALGSDRARIVGLVLREGAALVSAGLAAGAVGAVLLRTVIRSQLYGVGAFDPVVMLTVVAVLALAAFAACLGPARLAARVSPVVALSQQ
jgi:predicted permease